MKIRVEQNFFVRFVTLALNEVALSLFSFCTLFFKRPTYELVNIPV